MPNFFLRAAACLLLLPAVAAQAAETHPCARTMDTVERLACYDAAFPPVIDEAALAAAKEAERERALRDFGLNQAQVRERLPESEREEGPTRLEAAVSKVTYRDTGQRVITLDNGQVWLLTENTSKGPLSVGDKVTVRSAALGSFMIVTPGRATLRARRVL